MTNEELDQTMAAVRKAFEQGSTEGLQHEGHTERGDGWVDCCPRRITHLCLTSRYRIKPEPEVDYEKLWQWLTDRKTFIRCGLNIFHMDGERGRENPGDLERTEYWCFDAKRWIPCKEWKGMNESNQGSNNPILDLLLEMAEFEKRGEPVPDELMASLEELANSKVKEKKTQKRKMKSNGTK